MVEVTPNVFTVQSLSAQDASERFSAANFLKFNSDKTECIRFSGLHDNCSCLFVFKATDCCSSVTHLGCTLTANLLDGDDIFRCSRGFIRKLNGILIEFGFCDPFVLTNLPVSVCLSVVVFCGHLSLVLLSIWMSV